VTGPKIYVVLAFDHELSLGGASDYDRNLFSPTRDLLATAHELGVRIVLFTDVLCAIMHERWNVPSFVEPYRASLTHAIEAGHDVQLHLHPHWMTSKWHDGAFVPSRDFALSDFGTPGKLIDIEGIVRSGVVYLRELCLGVDPDYRCIAFRAGGNNLSPETSRILHALYNEGIRIDSSIIKGFRFSSDISRIDFSAMTDRANWFIPLDGPVSSYGPQGIFEVPIASAPRTTLNNLPFLARRVLHRRRRYSHDGYSIHEAATGTLEKLKRLFPHSAWPLSFDNFEDTASDVFAVLRGHIEAHPGEEEIFCATVSHPKSMGTHARSVFRGFVERARTAFGDRLEFLTFSDIVRQGRIPQLADESAAERIDGALRPGVA
jgi:hypothetical protein